MLLNPNGQLIPLFLLTTEKNCRMRELPENDFESHFGSTTR